MGIIDFLIIVVFAYYIAIGLQVGLSKQILSFGNWILALFITLLLLKPFASFLEETAVFSLLNQKVVSFLVNRNGFFNAPFNYEQPEVHIAAALSELRIPRFVGTMIAGRIDYTALAPNLTVAAVLAPSLTAILLMLFGFLFLFIVFLMIVRMVVNLIDDILSFSIFGIVNRLGGVAFSLAKGIIVVSVLMLLLSTLAALIPGLHRFLIRDLRLDDDGFGLGRFFYRDNPLFRLINMLFRQQ